MNRKVLTPLLKQGTYALAGKLYIKHSNTAGSSCTVKGSRKTVPAFVDNLRVKGTFTNCRSSSLYGIRGGTGTESRAGGIQNPRPDGRGHVNT